LNANNKRRVKKNNHTRGATTGSSPAQPEAKNGRVVKRLEDKHRGRGRDGQLNFIGVTDDEISDQTNHIVQTPDNTITITIGIEKNLSAFPPPSPILVYCCPALF
jgi:hypothetical protein